ncbi:MAG: peptide chain release factor N(5)-glutamine methyltransferase [Nocardioidaceae bacterium]|nr:peptide chain release factor N(5)-glutamine methyltransferase [Nocardioidaceae bacterium]MCL2613523.1 peptide chain release factor N(5)-glutamine methyltransferase [Nocardioidaceae bacterium]
MSSSRHALLADAVARLSAAGVPSPEYDAAELLAHVLATTRAKLALVTEVTAEAAAEFATLVARRAERKPLQHLTGTAGFRYVELAVGPGVFTPRPETELLAGWAVDASRAAYDGSGSWPVVVDLCTGSGAIARAIKDEVPLAEVHACELDPSAYPWAERNLAGTDVDLRQGDLATEFDDLVGRVDVVVSNPPYVPLEAWESVAPEARDHDPHLALFSGEDGLDAIRVIAQRAAALLEPGGVLGFEHADVQGESAPAVLAKAGHWTEIRDRLDLAGRPRFTTARRVGG